ncbi:MAG: BamA/TamA family outer membrane protein [Pirellulales bacterium]|nr:BamA/TamA family outer membrane protein [Pirellulales bacterium]
MRLRLRHRWAVLLIAVAAAQGCQQSGTQVRDATNPMLPRMSATPSQIDQGKVVLAGLDDESAVVRGQNYGTRSLPSFNTNRTNNYYSQYTRPNTTTTGTPATPVNQPGTPLGLPSNTVQPNFAQPNGAPPRVIQPAPNPGVGVQPAPGVGVQPVPGQPGVLPPPVIGGPQPGGPVLFNNPQYNPVPEPVPEGWVDLDAYMSETETGRFMFGVGVNSDAGLTGSIVIDEKNFDWRRYPRSWDDVRNFRLFRGGGQRLRIEAVPGTELQRYMFNFSDPFWMDTPVSLSVSGGYFTRRFEDWDEERLFARFGLGYQFPQAPDLSVSAQLRGESIDISDFDTPAPAELARVGGHNSLYGARVSVQHDTRDNSFAPTEGHLIELGAEYVIGSWQYPRATVDMRQHFMLRERADGSGRHVLSLNGRLGVAGKDTPVYDNFFAGGFTTLRGFEFRGASPKVDGVRVGGQFQLLGSVEYMFPLTANDALRAVTFVDFGTVEPNARIFADNFRVAPGFGFRLNIPAMGQAPLAFDFAFPVAEAAGDDTRVFSFFIGFGR